MKSNGRDVLFPKVAAAAPAQVYIPSDRLWPWPESLNVGIDLWPHMVSEAWPPCQPKGGARHKAGGREG